MWYRYLPFLFSLAGISAAFAQDARGRIAGRLIDPSGAAIPSVEVAATNDATMVVVLARSNDAGLYELPYLAPGVYTVVVAAPGFKRYERSGVEVRVGDRLTLDITLDVGQITESVTVTGRASLIESSTASLGQVVDTKRLLELPLPGGNAFSLARLSPGIVNLAVPNHPSLGPAVEVASNLSVNGVRGGNIEFSIDGSPSMWGTNTAYVPPADMVAEFKVQTANYDASNGRAPGGNVNVVLRSGTNKLHSTLYWFHNNQALSGMDLFQRQLLYNPLTGPVTDEKRQQANPRNILNRFGVNFGGPVLLPKLYNGKNRTFWVYGFEGLTRPGIERGNNFYTVPTPRQRQGDFSELLALGPTYQIYDPSTIAAAPGGRFSRQPFPGNVIPRARLDRAAQSLLPYWPEPNTQGTADFRNNYQRLPRSWNEFTSHTAKVDHNFSPTHRMFVRYNQTFQLFSSGQVFENTATGQDRFRNNYGAGLDDVYVISPTMLMNLRYGFSRFIQRFEPLAGGFDLAGAGFSKALADAIDPQARTFPQISVAGLQTIGTHFPSKATSTYHVWAGDFTKTAGSHTVRFGGEYRLYREHNYNFNFGTPQIAFAAAWTRGPLDNSPTAPIGQGFASYLLGIPTGGQLNVNDSFAEQSSSTGMYVQDDWRVTPRLTVNLGLRYDYDGAVTERFNRTVRSFDFAASNPVEAQAKINYARSPIPELPVNQFRALGGLTFAGADGQPRTLWRGDRNNLSPRIGIAWNPVAKTVIRAGYGIYFVPLGVDRVSVNQSGYSVRNALVPSTDNGLTFLASLANPFPSGFDRPAGASGGLATDTGRSVSFFLENPRNGYMQRYSFGIQRELPKAVLVESTYVGNRGTGLSVGRPLNPVPLEWLSTSPTRDQPVIDRNTAQVANPFFPMLAGTDLAGRTVNRTQLLRPYPHFTGVSRQEQIGYSWYHSWQSRVERRLSGGFTLQASHTWSKMMEANGFRNGGDPFLEEVVSDLDRRHRFTASGIYELPFGPGKAILPSARGVVRQLAAGWQIQTVWQRNTGAPIGFGNVLLVDDIRNVAIPSSERTLDRWFNTAAFNRNPAEQLAQNVEGLSSRFSGLRNPFQETWDFSAVKNFQLGEGFRLQFRAEFLNAMNRSNFVGPNTSPTDLRFGSITATNGVPRQIHFGLKLIY